MAANRKLVEEGKQSMDSQKALGGITVTGAKTS